jgi:hypothetical protein
LQGRKADVKKYNVGRVAGVVLVGGLVIGFGSVAATIANAAVGELVADAFGNAFGDLGGDVGCCGCDDLSILCDCFGCSDMSCDSCGDVCESCGSLLEGCCELVFGCLCGILTGL